MWASEQGMVGCKASNPDAGPPLRAGSPEPQQPVQNELRNLRPAVDSDFPSTSVTWTNSGYPRTIGRANETAEEDEI
jgi:hypothetical protein